MPHPKDMPWQLFNKLRLNLMILRLKGGGKPASVNKKNHIKV